MSDFLNNLFELQGKNRWAIARTSVRKRIEKLQRLRKAIVKRQQEFYDAVWKDFHKPQTEAWLTEVFPVLQEIDHTVNHLPDWMEDKDGSWSFLFPLNRSRSHFEPKGRVLIMAPWNYPFLLFVSPIVAAIAAGNVVIAKPSHKTPHVAAFLESLFAEVFPQNEVAVVLGAGTELGDKLLAHPFDHVFFTGSPKVGAHVAECAARMHAGVTLELGGKSPVIILDEVKIKDAAKKIAWGKCLNAGQTCIAPDFVLCPSKLVQPLADAIADNIKKMYGDTEDSRRLSKNFVHIVESRTVERHQVLIKDACTKGATAVIGAQFTPEDIENRYTPATVLTGVTPDMKIMESEIFGPILPIVAYDSLDEAITFVQNRPKPLAIYIFGKSEAKINEVIARTTSGSTCVNHCILQIENLSVPFGGVGMSGTGNYHGFYGFKTFSHERNIMEQGAFDAVNYLYPPYHQKGDKGFRAKIQRFFKAMLKQA
ncbi:MAG: aldehyde dehydrogenase family protein [Fibrobacter sp.]|uniref:aldehyde dehydrogenase family protein n=1 Tax=Fibrobacter sp. TaxID=35828 RepID=UPI0025C2A73F|nr:aldehyde dehydrogenase family protein [Fibrobacter sp.]MBS7271867.1 aldehyde dehydrogenase family protein [Fibrobacter sp.]MCI6437480.1 aldehyde dehydrogenase family protein [Fibrobacter sp.]MDD7496818.1 aldehyde dehydrogenase family protein [Fibrobacter sp.]MDY5723439.1 aldehyde dehydrogenase family protein [Fibrobacter sp.]